MVKLRLGDTEDVVALENDCYMYGLITWVLIPFPFLSSCQYLRCLRRELRESLTFHNHETYRVEILHVERHLLQRQNHNHLNYNRCEDLYSQYGIYSLE